jgi:hypothetical protein
MFLLIVEKVYLFLYFYFTSIPQTTLHLETVSISLLNPELQVQPNHFLFPTIENSNVFSPRTQKIQFRLKVSI